MIHLYDLSSNHSYCIVRDLAMRESIVVSGAALKANTGRGQDYRSFSAHEQVWPGYELVDCGRDRFIAIWRDPTRPELNHQAPVEPPPTITAPAVKPSLSIPELVVQGAVKALERLL